MAKTKADNRTQLLEEAEKTTYRCGFENTAIAEIAEEFRGYSDRQMKNAKRLPESICVRQKTEPAQMEAAHA